MAKLTNNRAKAAIAKEQKRLDAIQKKMETQRKKEEFGESWKYSLKDEHKQALKEIVGDFGTPNLVDSVDYNSFFDPINFYKEEDGSVRQLDYKKYLEYEEAYQEVIDDCDKIINDEIDTSNDSAKEQLSTHLTKKTEKKKSKPKIPEYLQKLYQNWTKYFNRFVPLYDKYVCSCCGKALPQDKYFLVYNEGNLGRIEANGKMHTHICMDCCKNLYEYLFYEKADKDGEKAMKWLCSYLNIYYDDVSYFKAKKTMEEKDRKTHIVEEYMSVISRSATLKGKVFLESPDVNVSQNKGDSKADKIINSKTGSVPEDLEEEWSKADLEAKRQVIKMVGYDPFYFEVEKDRKILYKDLLGMMEQGMELDGLKVQAAIQIVLSFKNIRELNEKYRKKSDTDAPVSELKALSELKKKELETITSFSRDNGFGERYAISKAKGENTFSGIMAKMNEMKYENAILNMYDIETSKSINQAADASFAAIFNQLSMSEAEVYKTCQDQLKKLLSLQRENATLTENLRLAKRELAEKKLEEEKRQYDKEHGDDTDNWGGY